MTKVLKEDWLAVADEEIYPVLHPAGTELKGDLRDRAERLGKLVDAKPAARSNRGDKKGARPDGDVAK